MAKLTKQEVLEAVRNDPRYGQLNHEQRTQVEIRAMRSAGLETTKPLPGRPSEAPAVPGTAEVLAKGLARGGIQAVTALPDLAVTLPNVAANWLLEQIGTEFRFPQPPHAGETLTRMAGVEPPAGASFLQRMGGRVAEEVGAGIPGFYGIRGAARLAQPPLARVGTQVPGTRVQAARDVLAAQPRSALTGEIAAATGAGLGAQALTEAMPEDPRAEMTGQLIGGMAPAGVSTAVGQLRRFSPTARFLQAMPTFTEAGMKRQVGEQLERMGGIGERGFEKLERTQELEQAIPGFRATTAQATGEPGLLMAERGAVRREAGTVVRFQERMAEQNDAIHQYMQANLPKGMPIDVAKANVEQLYQSSQAALDQALRRADGQVKAAVQKLGHGVDPRVAGLAVREQILKKMRVWDQSVDNAYAAVDPENRIELDTAEIKAAAEAVQPPGPPPEPPELYGPTGERIDLPTRGVPGRPDLSAIEPPANFPPTAKRILDNLPDVARFSDLRILRSVLNNELNMARLRPDRNNRLIARLEEVRNAVEATVQRLETDPVLAQQYPNEHALFRRANAVFRAGAQVFRQGPVADVVRQGPFRQGYQTPAGDVPFLFWQRGPGTREDVDQFIAAMGGRRQAQEALRGVAIHELRTNGVIDETGTINQARFQRWLETHAEALEAFPELKRKFGAANAAALEAKKVAKTVSLRRKDLDTQATKLFLNNDPETIVQKVRRSQNPLILMRAVVQSAKGDPGVKRALRREVWQQLMRQIEVRGGTPDIAGNPLLSPANARQILRHPQSRALLETLYSPDELRIIENVVDAIGIQGRSAASALPGESQTAVNIFGIFSVQQMFSRAYNFQIGRVSKAFLGFEVAIKWLNRTLGKIGADELRAILDDALYDPDIARTLMLMARQGDPVRIHNALKGHLLNLNLGQREQEEGRVNQ